MFHKEMFVNTEKDKNQKGSGIVLKVDLAKPGRQENSLRLHEGMLDFTVTLLVL